jgi:HPt (histidine-containing phosphotransfer) domain-containing protein
MFDQITNNEDQKTAGVAGITGVAVDLELLNAFEELQSDDGSDLIVELIDLYLEDAPQRIRAIREAAVATEWVLLKRAAHNLKGSSANLGVQQVAETCKKLEGLERDQSTKGVEFLLQQMDHEFSRASEALLAERRRRLQ